jgi:ABC-type Fe3+/spermidine/putrescine transport system ATPase subunit
VFVAAFIGTMNRVEATVQPDPSGVVESAGHRLPVHAARDWASGPHVLMLIRPEVIDLQTLSGDSLAGGETMIGTVKSHTFLGPVTRVEATTPIGDLMVDVPSVEALSVSIGARVSLTWDPASPRLIELPPGAEDMVGPAAVTAEDELQPA